METRHSVRFGRERVVALPTRMFYTRIPTEDQMETVGGRHRLLEGAMRQVF